MEASCVYADELIIVVLCPYCSKLHKHLQGSPMSSHCSKGEYRVGHVFSDQFIAQALKQHQHKMESRRKKPTETE